MCPVYSVNDLTGLYPSPTLSQRERKLRRLADWQSDLHNQTCVFRVRRFDGSVMQVHRAGGDGQAQAGPACLTIAIIFHSIKGSKDLPNGFFRHALAVIAHANHRESIGVNRVAS